MVFSSSQFLFVFLPVALAACLALRRVAYLQAILLVSVLFYFWSAGRDTLVLLGMIAGNYLGALGLRAGRSRLLFTGLVLADLAVLCWFKYARFIARNLDQLLGSQLSSHCRDVVLPAGVSFFVFQAISYLADVRRGDIPAERSLVRYGAYQSFFPHLIAGPIVRFRDVIGDLLAPRVSPSAFANGVTRFAHGLLKKALIADALGPVADSVFGLKAHQLDCSLAWIGAVAYALQIYFDFSGYSDMAIGMAQMFGITFHENFERPYASRSITEFWRRWHISLSSWFRDYVYIPLGGSRRGAFANYRNLLIVFAATGLWHGAAWTFVAWGLFHGAFLVLERLLFREPAKSLRHFALRYAYCLPVVLFGWVLFRAPTLHRTFAFWRAMLSPFASSDIAAAAARASLTPYPAAALLVGSAIFFAPGSSSLGSRLTQASATPLQRVAGAAYTVAALLVCAVLVLTSNYHPFLYFNF